MLCCVCGTCWNRRRSFHCDIYSRPSHDRLGWEEVLVMIGDQVNNKSHIASLGLLT